MIALETTRQILFYFGIILGAGVCSGFLSQKARVPDVVVFLLMGILLGPEVSGILKLRVDSAISQIILIFGSCYILFDGGAAVRLKVLKEACITITLLATAGVLIMTTITGVAAHYVFGAPTVGCATAWSCHRADRSGHHCAYFQANKNKREDLPNHDERIGV